MRGLKNTTRYISNSLSYSTTKYLSSLCPKMSPVLIIIFRAVASGYKKSEGKAPSGITNALEPLILFVRDEIAIPSIGEKHAYRFMPFLLTVFFFIWLCNILGLIPFIGGFNITGGVHSFLCWGIGQVKMKLLITFCYT